MAKVTAEAIAKFRELDTTCVSDALDRLGIRGACHGISPQVTGVKAVGPAYTVSYRPRGVERGPAGDFIDDVEAGQVVVIDNGGRTWCTVWGDLMTLIAQRRGVAGTVIDGVCRDLPGIIQERYPMFTRGRYMATGKDRVEFEALNVPVTVSDIQVKPGDIMVCDDTGVVVVPAEKAEDVLKAALEIDAAERKMFDMMRQGMTLKEAREKMGYYTLQTRRT